MKTGSEWGNRRRMEERISQMWERIAQVRQGVWWRCIASKSCSWQIGSNLTLTCFGEFSVGITVSCQIWIRNSVLSYLPVCQCTVLNRTWLDLTYTPTVNSNCLLHGWIPKKGDRTILLRNRHQLYRADYQHSTALKKFLSQLVL